MVNGAANRFITAYSIFQSRFHITRIPQLRSNRPFMQRRALGLISQLIRATAQSQTQIATTSLLETPYIASFRQFLHQIKQSNELRPGNIINVDNRLFQVIKIQHTQGAGRQVGNVQLELRDLINKSKHPMKLSPSKSIEVVRLDEVRYQFLYREGNLIHAMHATTFEQVALPADLFGKQAAYLHEGLEVAVHMHQGENVLAELPETITLAVVETPPKTKALNDNSFKRAILEGGVEVQVPPFVEQGDKIVFDTKTGEFLKRG